MINKVNEGVSSARNNGLDVAQGEYILFVDSDDYISVNACEQLYKIAIVEMGDIVQGKGMKFKEKEDIHIVSNSARIHRYLNIEALHQLFDYYDSDIRVVPWNKLFHKSLFITL